MHSSNIIVSYCSYYCRMLYKPGTWLDGYPTLVNGDGDGTVNIRSLEGCLHWTKQHWNLWSSKTKLKSVSQATFPNADHMGILRDPRVLDYIKKLFSN